MPEDMEMAVRQAVKSLEAFNREDFDTAVEWLHPEVEWQRVGGIEQPLVGRDAVREFLEPDSFESQRTEVLGTEVEGDRLMVRLKVSVVGRGSGIEVSTDAFQVVTVRDGQAYRVAGFINEAEALRVFRGETGG